MASSLNAALRPTLRASLREGSDDLHRRVERHPLLAPLMKPGLTCQAYASVLQAFYGFYAALEPWLVQALETQWLAHATYRYQCRAPLLAQDLLDLGFQPATCSLQTGEPPITMHSLEQVMGVLYVLEGATQGGRVIAPHVAYELNLSPEFGARYFYLHVEQRWKELLALMASSALPSYSSSAVESARETFRTLQDHLDQWHQTDLRS